MQTHGKKKWRHLKTVNALMRMIGVCVCVCQCWALLMPSCSLTRTENPSGPTWSGRTPALPPALRPPPPCARRPPPPARCRPPGRTCAPAVVWRSWTDTCWRWEAGHTFRLFVFLFTLTDRNSSSAQGNRELMKKDAVLTLPLFLDLGARRKFARNLTQFGDWKQK